MDRNNPPPPASADGDFFTAHAWCLNPVLSAAQLLRRLGETWGRLRRADTAWQQEECWINLYLLSCGLDCTLSDYLSYRPWPGNAVRRRGPAAWLVSAARSTLNAPFDWHARKLKQRVRQYKNELDRCVQAVCESLVDRALGGPGDLSALERALPVVLSGTLPSGPSEWRMRIPEAFRCQDLTHHDVFAMAQRFAACHAGDKAREIFVVGPRTAGAYFAPLIGAFLRRQGFRCADWISIRPKEGLSRAEQRTLAQAGERGARVLMVDDHPNTGNTFTLLVRLLGQLGIAPQNMTILAPDHPAQADWKPLVAPVEVVTLDPAGFHKAALLRDEARLLAQLCEWVAEGADATLRFEVTPLDRVNLDLEARYGDSFQVRLKRAFRVQWSGPAQRAGSLSVIVKSVGWGWLGYHAYLIADRLQGFVPRLLGLRDGLMFLEWMGDETRAGAACDAEAIAAVAPRYLAARASTLRLERDPTLDVIGYRRIGRDRIAAALRRPFGALWGRLALNALKRKLARAAPPFPTLVDGSMALENWVTKGHAVCKVDFEHHNFGGGEQDIVDPAYDLAGASLSLGLDRDAEERMVADYAHLSGDAGVRDRLLPYQYLVGLLAMDRAATDLRRKLPAERHAEANLRFLAGRNYLAFQFNRHQAARIPFGDASAWSSNLFFLDLDGVFDIQALGFFPHTTPCGLVALRRLQQHGFSVVLNTGRGVEHVRDYCRSYGLPGGIAEYGCIFVDRVAQREHALFSAEQADQLARLRARVAALTGVHLDPGYGGAVHAYRYRRGHWVGLERDEAHDLLRAGGFDALDALCTDTDTYFLPKGVNKGTSLAAVIERVVAQPALIAAMGDSIQDADMLSRANLGFVPANASAELRAIARNMSHVHITRQARQKGLLEAVNALLRERETASIDCAPASDHPVDWALDAIDASRLRRWTRLFAGGAGPRRHATAITAAGIARESPQSCR